jgi:hypothetical protein
MGTFHQRLNNIFIDNPVPIIGLEFSAGRTRNTPTLFRAGLVGFFNPGYS